MQPKSFFSHRFPPAMLALAVAFVASITLTQNLWTHVAAGPRDYGRGVRSANSERDVSTAIPWIASNYRNSLVHINSVHKKSATATPAAGGKQFPLLAPPGSSDDELEGLGSGIIVSRDGYILTSSHLVRGARDIEVKFRDGTTYKAQVIGADQHTEVALLKIDASHLTPAALGDSDSVLVGEWVVAMGSPFGLDQTVTVGIISAKGRSNLGIAGQEDFLQTDAAINPGNSGGPLINLEGEVIGINTAIASKSGGSMGIGFAIPINMARTVMEKMIEEGGLRRGWLGVAVQKLSEELAESFGYEGTAGVLIGDVQKDGPAHKAGIQPGDIVLTFGGKPTTNVQSFRNLVAASSPGASLSIELVRRGDRQTVTVEVTESPDEIAAAQSVERDEPSVTEPEVPFGIGAVMHDITPDVAQRVGLSSPAGALVTAVMPGEIASKAGLRAGDVIIAIEGTEIQNVEQLRSELKEQNLTKGVRLQVRSLGGVRRYVLLKKTD